MGDLPNPIPAKPAEKLPEKAPKQATKPPQSTSVPTKTTDTKSATPTPVTAASSSSSSSSMSPALKKRKVAKTQTPNTPGETGSPQEEPPGKAGPGPKARSQNNGTASGSAPNGTGPQRGGEKQQQQQRDPGIQHPKPVVQHSVRAGGEVQLAGGAGGGQSNSETTGSGTISSRLPTDDPPVIRVSNVPDGCQDEDIRLLFAQYGGMVKVQGWKSSRLKKTNYYVTFSDHRTVDLVMKLFDRNVVINRGVWSKWFKKDGYRTNVNIPTGNEWFKYESATEAERAAPTLPGKLYPQRNRVVYPPASSFASTTTYLPYDEDDPEPLRGTKRPGDWEEPEGRRPPPPRYTPPPVPPPPLVSPHLAVAAATPPIFLSPHPPPPPPPPPSRPSSTKAPPQPHADSISKGHLDSHTSIPRVNTSISMTRAAATAVEPLPARRTLSSDGQWLSAPEGPAFAALGASLTPAPAPGAVALFPPPPLVPVSSGRAHFASSYPSFSNDSPIVSSTLSQPPPQSDPPLSLFIPDVIPTVAPISPPPPGSDVALLARLHELEHLLADARDQSVQIYARLESTEADCLVLAGRVLIAERGRDEAVRAMKEVEREREVALRALGEVRSREEVERALKEERREAGEVEGMVWKEEQPGWAYVDRLLGRG